MTVMEIVDGGVLLGYGGGVVLRATALLLGVLTLAAILRGASASARHALWTVTLITLLALPVLPAVLPELPVSVPAALMEAPSFGGSEKAGEPSLLDSGADPLSGADQAVPAAQGVADGPGRFPAQATAAARGIPTGEQDSLSPGDPATATAAGGSTGGPDYGGWAPVGVTAPGVLLLLWLMGVALFGASLAIGLWRAGLLVRRADRGPEEAWLRSLEQARREVGLRGRVRLAFSSGVRTPLVGGVLRPVVLLPERARSWSAERRDIVLLHELIHVKRADPLRQVLGRMALALYWFHPLAWLAARAASLAREQACDEAVVALGRRPSTYARHLMHLAETGSLPVPALSRLHRPPLEKRIMAILRPHVPRRGSTVLAVAALAVTWALAVAMAAPAQVVDPAPPGQPSPVAAIPALEGVDAFGTDPGPMELPPDPMEAPEPPELPAVAPPGHIQPDPGLACLPRPGGVDFLDGRDFGPGEATGARRVWSRGAWFIQRSLDDAMLCIRTHGEVVLAGGGGRIASMGEGAWVVLAVRAEIRGEDRLQRMEIVAGPDGPEHAWFEDGRERPFDDEARQWRDAMLEVLGAHVEIPGVRGEEARLRGEIARTRGEAARYHGEIARIRGEGARLRGEMARIRGADARLRGEEARIRGEEARHRGEIVRLRSRITALEWARRATEEEEARAHLSTELQDLEVRLRGAEVEASDEDVEAAVADVRVRLEAHREEVAPRIAELERLIQEHEEEAPGRIAEIQTKIAGLEVDVRIREIEERIQELNTERRIQELEAGSEEALDRLRTLIQEGW